MRLCLYAYTIEHKSNNMTIQTIYYVSDVARHGMATRNSNSPHFKWMLWCLWLHWIYQDNKQPVIHVFVHAQVKYCWNYDSMFFLSVCFCFTFFVKNAIKMTTYLFSIHLKCCAIHALDYKLHLYCSLTRSSQALWRELWFDTFHLVADVFQWFADVILVSSAKCTNSIKKVSHLSVFES